MDHIPSSVYALNSSDAWHSPVFPLHISQDTVHVWRFWLRQPDAQVYDHLQLLSPPERRKTVSYYSLRNRKRFIIARGILRRILGSYLNRAPSQLQFTYHPWGKPSLQRSATDEIPLQFNLTHAQDIALCAVTATRRVGIDVEWVHDRPHLQTAIPLFFSTQEVNQITMAPTNQRLNAFYERWTRKEAYLKAIGAGINETQFLSDSYFTEPLHAQNDTPQWTTIAIAPAPNYVATLVIEGHNVDLQCLHYPAAYDDQHQCKIPVQG
jgi:4'-phosphopantetheinyl transferase